MLGLRSITNHTRLVARQHRRNALDKVAEINSAVGEIAAGAREQSTALQEVNAAINEMDRVTQANAEMAERATNAGHVLKEKGEKLRTTIDQFRIRGGEKGRSEAAPRGLEAA